MNKRIALLVCFLVLGAALVFAHTPIFNCYWEADGSIYCEGGFSDGSSAGGVEIRVEDPNGKVLFKSKLNKVGELIIKKADLKGAKKFVVIFDAGPGHVAKVKSEDIEK